MDTYETIKFRISSGDLELEFEGTLRSLEEFLSAPFERIIETRDLLVESTDFESSTVGDDGELKSTQRTASLSVRQIAMNLGAKKGKEVILSAAVSLQLFKGLEEFTQRDMLAEAKLAKGFYKQSITNNASSYVSALQSENILVEGRSGYFSIHPKAEIEISEKLKGL